MKRYIPVKDGRSWTISPKDEGWVFERTYPTKWRAHLALETFLQDGRPSDYFKAAREEKERRKERALRRREEREQSAEPQQPESNPGPIPQKIPASSHQAEEAKGVLQDLGEDALAGLASVVVILGFMSLATFGVLLAVWSWLWIGSLIEVPAIIQGGLAFILWLALTALVPWLIAFFGIVFGGILGSILAGVGTGALVWLLIGIEWQALLAACAMAFTVAYGAIRAR